MQRRWNHIFRYWRLLFRAVRWPNRALTLDATLEESSSTAQSVAGWSGPLIFLSVFTHPVMHPPGVFVAVTWPAAWSMTMMGVAMALMCAISGFAMYGLLRLYTLVSHVLATNLFQVRGQRLRLLNVHNEVLSLALPASIAMWVYPLVPVLGWVIAATAIGLACVKLTAGYNLVYHKGNATGLWLAMGALLVTAFVFAIGAIAIGVAIGVVAFIAAAVFRPHPTATR